MSQSKPRRGDKTSVGNTHCFIAQCNRSSQLGYTVSRSVAGRVYKFSLKQDNVFHKTVFQGKEKVTKTHKKMTSNVHCSNTLG